jgi:variant SH3 domain-containing protein
MEERSGQVSYGAIVTQDYAAQFADPITLAQGEVATLDGREEPWEDNPDWLWVWGENAAGKGGWIPRPLLRIEGSSGVALEDYDARELSVVAGERINALREACGWAWCIADAHRSGWVPLSHLRRMS